MNFMKRIASIIIAAAMLAVSAKASDEYTNLAFNRPAFHSSAINYDLTAQLAVDGVADGKAPRYYSITTDGKPLPKEKVGWMFDYRHFAGFSLEGGELDLLVKFHNFTVKADSIRFRGRPRGGDAGVETSVRYADGTWGRPDGSRQTSAIRFVSQGKGVSSWDAISAVIFNEGQVQDIYALANGGSCWMSNAHDSQWIYVDLGEIRRFDRISLSWQERPESGEVLVSDNGRTWSKIADLSADNIAVEGKARYVKLQMYRPGGHIALQEMEVMGWKPEEKASSSAWRLVREDLADNPRAWIPAKVPGTVLASYIDNGIVPDPAWGENNHQISDSYFKHNFIYRGTLKAPESKAARTYLNFDGVNWKADVRMNGVSLGHIDGAFIRSSYDVTDIIKAGDNDIEVLVYCNDNPSCGKGNTLEKMAWNGGILGADNPTFHASVGWDWIPTVHGRNMGIWNDVYFSQSGDILLRDPYISTTLNLPDTTRAEVTISATLENKSRKTRKTVVKGTMGEHAFAMQATLRPGETRELSTSLTIDNPRLWWPNGYGRPELYDVHMEALSGGKISDSKDFKTGIRQMTYSTDEGRLTIWVNGRRLSGRGGNWGFSEYNLRYTGKEYDTAVRLHREENFTMIRNWVGQTMDDEFWEACDRHGIMVWQDFWLANPADGPDPDDEKMFMSNADDLLLRIRNHPCIALYVGRNEGMPTPTLDKALKESISKYHKDIFYIPHSAEGVVSGFGPYHRISTYEHFRRWTDYKDNFGQRRIHSEKGTPNVPNFESFVKFMPREAWWPQNNTWAMHDWSVQAAQRVDTFNDAVRSMFGEPRDAEQFCQWAQWVNYDSYRAIFESRSECRRGLLLWMSHSAWPSFVWSTYDYYFDPTAGYFGCKKANEPLHIMWNPLKEVVEVVNWSAGDRIGLKAVGKVLDMYGRKLAEESVMLDSAEDSTVPCFSLCKPDEDVYFYSLALYEGDSLVSENFYVQGRETDNFKALHKLGPASVKTSTDVRNADGKTVLTFKVSNTGEVPAMMLRLMVCDRHSGERILPASYSDNYFHLMPSDSRIVTVTILDEDLGGREPEIRLTGFNLEEKKTIRVLAIGNSFSEDSIEQNLHLIAREKGTPMVIANMYIGGCSIDRHVNNIRGDIADYRYTKFDVDGNKTITHNVALSQVIEQEPWDYISVQQVSGSSGYPETYSQLGELVEWIRANAPQAEVVFHQTWAYSSDSGHGDFARYERNQQKMHSMICSAVAQECPKVGIKTVIPTGPVVQALRDASGDYNLTRDGFHLTYGLGRYAAALTWYRILTGSSVIGLQYRPDGSDQRTQPVSEQEARLAQEIVEKICCTR